MVLICPDCWNELKEGEIFCSDCGKIGLNKKYVIKTSVYKTEIYKIKTCSICAGQFVTYNLKLDPEPPKCPKCIIPEENRKKFVPTYCRVCGRMFTPRYRHYHTCPLCFD